MRTRALTGLVLTGLLLAACGTDGEPVPSSAAAPNAGGTIVVAPAFAPRGGYAIDTDDSNLLRKLGVTEALVVTDEAGAPGPGLATTWTRTSPTAWDFTLREGVQFQDGTPLTADAVVTALDHVTSVDAPPRAVAGSGLSATAVDERTVRVTTAEPDAVLPVRLSSAATGVLSPSAYASTPPTVIGTGTGPFTLTETRGTASARLVRHEGYWGEPALLDGAEVRFLPDAGSRVAALQSGDVQIAEGIPATSLVEVEGRDDVVVEQYTAPRTTTVYTNVEAPALDDVRVREALSLAVDRTLLVETVLEGTGVPASGVFGPAVAFGDDDPAPTPDVEAARALLADAGYGDASPLTLRLWSYPERPELPDLATAVQGMLEEVGVSTEIRIAEYASLEPEVLAGEFDLFILSRSYLTDFPDAAGFLASDYGCEGSYNINRFCSSELDALVDGLGDAEDSEDRAAAFREADEILQREHVGIPLLHTGAITGVSDRVQGYVADPLERFLLTPTLSLS